MYRAGIWRVHLVREKERERYEIVVRWWYFNSPFFLSISTGLIAAQPALVYICCGERQISLNCIRRVKYKTDSINFNAISRRLERYINCGGNVYIRKRTWLIHDANIDARAPRRQIAPFSPFYYWNFADFSVSCRYFANKGVVQIVICCPFLWDKLASGKIVRTFYENHDERD